MFLQRVIIALVLASPLIETNLYAQRHGGGFGSGSMADSRHGMGRQAWFAELNLTTEQMTKIRELRHARMKAVKELREELDLKKRELIGLLKTLAPDEKIKEKNLEIQEIQKKLSGIHSEMLIEINKILTPEQRAKFSQHMLATP